MEATQLHLFLWVVGAVGTGFILVVGWVAARIVGRLDVLTTLLHQDFRELLHAHDKRITSLEDWRLSLKQSHQSERS